jgi:hypothetical protein
MSLPPDQPTRRVPVAPAAPRQVPVTPAVPTAAVYAGDDVYWREQVIARLDGVRTGLAIIGTVAVIALGLAIWALLREHQDRSSGSGVAARSAQIRGLRDDIDTLRSQIANRATTGQLEAVSKQVAAAGQSSTPATATDTSATDALNKSVSQLNQQVADLGQRVKALEDAASSASGTQTTAP